MIRMNKLFNNKHGAYPEALLFIFALIFAGIAFLSFYIPFVIPENFNAFSRVQLKHFSTIIFGSYHYLFYIATWLSTWFFLFMIILNIIVSLCFLDLCFEEIMSKNNINQKKLSYIIFSISIILIDFFACLYLYTHFLNF